MKSPKDIQQVIKDPVSTPDDPYTVWRNKQTPQNLNRVLDSLSPTINSALKTYSPYNVSPITQSKAKSLAAKAIKSYTPTPNVNLKTHVMSQLQALRRYSTHATQPMKLSEIKARELLELERVEREFADTHGRDASDVELADKLGLSINRIDNIRNWASSVVNTEGDARIQRSEPVVHTTDPLEVWIDYVYHDLGDIDRKILEWKLGRTSNALPTQEIARRLRISSAAVSQRWGKIQSRIMEGKDLKL